MASDPVEFCGEIKWETESAYLVFDGANEVWIPKSQVGFVNLTQQLVTLPEWLVIEKGLEGYELR